MKHIVLSLLLLLSIAMQSFVAVANLSDSHQIDSQHLQTTHSHARDDVKQNDLASSVEYQNEHLDQKIDEHNISDCHHCGHCQGSHAQWFAGKRAHQPTPLQLVSNRFFHLAQIKPLFIDELIRPPIA